MQEIIAISAFWNFLIVLIVLQAVCTLTLLGAFLITITLLTKNSNTFIPVMATGPPMHHQDHHHHH